MKSPSVKLKDEFKVSAWNGYQKDRKGNEDGQIVYITEKGTVWHSDYQCSYLQLSIQYVQYSELQNMRNEGGGKYHKCYQLWKSVSQLIELQFSEENNTCSS